MTSSLQAYTEFLRGKAGSPLGAAKSDGFTVTEGEGSPSLSVGLEKERRCLNEL